MRVFFGERFISNFYTGYSLNDDKVIEINFGKPIFNVDIIDDDFVIRFCKAYHLNDDYFEKTMFRNGNEIYEYKDHENGYYIGIDSRGLIVLKEIAKASQAQFN